MRLFYLILAGIFLSACSIQGMVEKSTPESVRADHAAHIDSLLAKDKSRILSAFNLDEEEESVHCLLYTSPSPRDATLSRMPSSA